VLAKPFDIDDLLGRVAEALNEAMNAER